MLIGINNKDVIGIRATYYIFCCRNKNWDSADNEILIFESFNLKQPIVNYLYLARFTIVHLKRQIKFQLLLAELHFHSPARAQPQS